MTRLLGAAWLAWCAFRDACGIASLALAVPVAHAPLVWGLFVVRVIVAGAAAVGIAKGRRWGLRLGVGYLGFVAVGLFGWMAVSDPVSASWSATVWSWPVLLVLVRDWRRSA